MLNNFHLVAITRKGQQTKLFHIPLHQDLQNQLTEIWNEQYDVFMQDVDEISFNAGYSPEAHEHFCLTDYDTPEWLEAETSQSVSELESIGGHEGAIDRIKGIAAFARNEAGEELVLFQNFSRAHVIQPGRFLFLQNDTYESAQKPGLSLDKKIAAIFFPAENKLLFHSFRITNTFLPLAEFYKEASEQEIHEVLDHDLLAPEDADILAQSANQWFRKRFAMLRDSGLLDNYTAQEIQQHSNGYDVDIQIVEGKIVFPADKPAAKKLLQFLNEEIFRGAITETLYETNSKREAD